MDTLPGLYFYIAAAVGIGMHLSFFIRGEWHLQAPLLLISHSACFYILFMAIKDTALQAIAGYLLALFSSILTYRVFFHRLRHFPGPFGASATKLWHVWKLQTGDQNHFLLADLHRRYGDFVRTGPSELTIYHPDVFMAIDGPSSHCIKADWYDLLYPHNALVTTRTKEIHGPRRRQWTRGFNASARLEYEAQIRPLISQLDARIQFDIAAGKASEATDLFKQLWFDRMAALVFSKTFNMLLNQRNRYLLDRVQRALSVLRVLTPVPWLLHIAFQLRPRVWISTSTDLAHYLFNPTDINDKPPTSDDSNIAWLTGDSILAGVAGSEPTSTAAITLFYELARHPSHAEKILAEISRVANICDGQAIARQCPHLTAVIFETLRLYPGLPTGGNRRTPLREGINIGGAYIPPETTIVAPRSAIGRREDSFEQPDSFIPERWTTRPEMVRNRAAYTPFGTGPRGCIGRAVAMNDLMVVTAHLLRKYRVMFPLGDAGESVHRDWKDQFTSSPGKLRLVFEPRG
ncbi:hypothetical protein BDV12DRAFT_202746 [Aspergillus spectabilis]